MLSLGGFFLALFLGDVILGCDQSQPVRMTDCEEMSESSFRTLSGTPTCSISKSIKNMFELVLGQYFLMDDTIKKFSKIESFYTALPHIVSLTARIVIKS